MQTVEVLAKPFPLTLNAMASISDTGTELQHTEEKNILRKNPIKMY